MKPKEIKKYMLLYLDEKDDITRNRIFNEFIYPFFDTTIDNVYKSLLINFKDEKDNNIYNDYRQDSLLKLLVIFKYKKDIKSIKNIKNFVFIVTRNLIINKLKESNRYTLKYIKIDFENYENY